MPPRPARARDAGSPSSTERLYDLVPPDLWLRVAADLSPDDRAALRAACKVTYSQERDDHGLVHVGGVHESQAVWMCIIASGTAAGHHMPHGMITWLW